MESRIKHCNLGKLGEELHGAFPTSSMGGLMERGKQSDATDVINHFLSDLLALDVLAAMHHTMPMLLLTLILRLPLMPMLLLILRPTLMLTLLLILTLTLILTLLLILMLTLMPMLLLILTLTLILMLLLILTLLLTLILMLRQILMLPLTLGTIP